MPTSDDREQRQPPFNPANIIWERTTTLSAEQRDSAIRNIEFFLGHGGAARNIGTIPGVAFNVPMGYDFDGTYVNYDPTYGNIYNPVGSFMVPVPRTDEELEQDLAMARQYQQAQAYFEAKDPFSPRKP